MFMLARHVCGATIDAADGKFGKLCDLVFDDQNWDIRSLVIDAGTWLHSRRVTIPPDLIRHRDWADHRLLIAELTRQQVLDSPGAETHVPLVQQARIEEARDIPTIQVLDRAKPPVRRDTPRRKRNMMMGFALGLGGGILLAFAFEYLDRSLKSASGMRVKSQVGGLSRIENWLTSLRS